MKSNLVAIGPGKPCINPTTDRWGGEGAFIETNYYGLCTKEQWEKIQQYQKPIVGSIIEGGITEELKITINKQMSISGRYSQIWQMDLINPGGGYVRTFAKFATPRLVEWNEDDINVKLPELQKICDIYNKTIGKQKAEYFKKLDEEFEV